MYQSLRYLRNLYIAQTSPPQLRRQLLTTSIPLRLNELLPESRFTLRTYCADGFECVCYCIPR